MEGSFREKKDKLFNSALVCVCAQSCLTLCNPMDGSPPGSSVHGISQARILEWVTISFSRGSSRPGTEPMSPAWEGGFFTAEPPEKSLKCDCGSFSSFWALKPETYLWQAPEELPWTQDCIKTKEEWVLALEWDIRQFFIYLTWA